MEDISTKIPKEIQKKEIKSNFMHKIKRNSKEKTFKKLSSNLTKYLFDYFTYKDLFEFGKINLFFINNIIDYINQNEPWPEKVRKFKSKYNLTIYQNEVDSTLKEAKIKKRRYKYPLENEKRLNYYQFDIDGNKYISIARTFDWAHKDNDLYWGEEKIEGSYEPNENVPYLITVCWLDTNFAFYHVKLNNYKLYFNEHFIKNSNIKERISLKVIIDENIVINESKFPSKKIFDNNISEKENSRLNEDFICFIKKEDFKKAKKDEKGDYIVKVEFNHGNDDYWKTGWFIDGGCLREITQKEMENEVKELNEKKEEDEKKKIFRRFEVEEEE